MKLPKFIDIYLRALLSAPWKFNLFFLSIVSGKSHDYLTRNLKGKYHFKDLLRLLLNRQALDGGYVIIDETDVDKSFAKDIKGLGWIYSNRKKKYIFGYHIVVAVWTNDKLTIPLGWKIYKKGGEETKLDLAKKLIDYTLWNLNISPKAFLFDSFYASEMILKHLINNNQNFISQVDKKRNLNKKSVKTINMGRPYWKETGYLTGNIHVQVVKNRRKYFITNKIGITREEQLKTYKIRWNIEEVFRFTKQSLGFERCQSTSLHAQNTHFGVCFLLYGLLQDIAEKTQMTDYQIKLEATLDVTYAESLNFMAYFNTA
jgi:hypothetical protein